MSSETTKMPIPTVVMLGNMLAKNCFPAVLHSPINAGAFCMLAGLVIVPVVSLFTRKPDARLISHVFSCYDRKVLVSVKDSIGESGEAE